MGRGLRFVTKRVGAPVRGWQWELTWRKVARPMKYGVCLTDVAIQKRKQGYNAVKKQPRENISKSGEGWRA